MIYFISDIHLGLLKRAQDKERENLLLQFFDAVKHDAEIIYIVGDLFDYWFEYKYVIPKFFYRTLTKLHELREASVDIEYLMGNHDFGHLDFFSDELNIEIHHEDIERTFAGKKFYIAHGDGKALNDAGYRFLKKILRAKWSNAMYRYVHPDLGIKLASHSSKTSRNYTDKKHYGELDGMELFAIEKIKEGFDYVVMGHRHQLIFNKIESGYYINLGDWINEPHYGVFDGESFRIENVADLINKVN